MICFNDLVLNVYRIPEINKSLFRLSHGSIGVNVAESCSLRDALKVDKNVFTNK